MFEWRRKASIQEVSSWDTKMAVWLTFLYFISLKSFIAEGVLPPYIPALRCGQRNRDPLIEQYFNLGFGYTVILGFLCIVHGIQLSLWHFKWILSRKGLRRGGNQTDPGEIISAVESELRHSGSSLGYRQMHQRITLDYGKVVDRETIRRILVVLDPEGVHNRAHHKLRRRKYMFKGPNFIWHIDGYDKLKPFRFCIHGAIDGYSRHIMWLEVGSSNNNPLIIANYYHQSLLKHEILS